MAVSDTGGMGENNKQDVAAGFIMAAVAVVDRPDVLDDAVRDIVVLGGAAEYAGVAEDVVGQMVCSAVGRAYEYGWQPADLVHVIRRDGAGRLVRLAADFVLEQAVVDGAALRAPQDWLDQLEVIADRPLDQALSSAEQSNPWWDAVFDGAGRWDAWHDVVLLLGHWLAIAPMPRLVPPPSSWGAGRRREPAGHPDGHFAGHSSGHDPKKLATIRALLAKAEATEFAEEADTFTAKAQDLMTRYAIDEALLADAADGIEVRSRRVHVDNPYASTKVQLLATVGHVNRVKAIWDDPRGVATIVGLPVDLDLAEMLFTSLLVQATRAMTDAGRATRGGHRLDRSPSFRRAFLLSYADRIGERLQAAETHAQQEESMVRADLLPVLARQSAAVEVEFARLFPHTTQGGAKRVDARGWHAGRAAADRAVLAKGQVDGRPA